jgi:hypothetical protein
MPYKIKLPYAGYIKQNSLLLPVDTASLVSDTKFIYEPIKILSLVNQIKKPSEFPRAYYISNKRQLATMIKQYQKNNATYSLNSPFI